MLRIRHNQMSFSDLEEETGYGPWSGFWRIRSLAFRHRAFSQVFRSRSLSTHFGTKKYDFFGTSFLFRVEDGMVTEIVSEIHEAWLDREWEERRRALEDEADEAEFAARCARRLNRKKKRGRGARRIR